MQRTLLVFGASAATMFLMGHARERMPVSIVKSSFVHKLTKARGELLFEEQGTAIMRRSEALDQDFDDMYVVRMPGKKELPFFVERLGEVIHFEPEQFVLVRLRDADKVAKLSHLMHHEGIACGALMRLEGDEMVREVRVEAGQPRVPIATDLPQVRSLVSQVSGDQIIGNIRDFSAVNTRHHDSTTGQEFSLTLKGLYESLANGRQDVSVELFDHGSKTPQDSVVIRITGSTRPDELVILGSHIDSISFQSGGSGRAPGADDNASGTATNLEVFRVLMASGLRPERTIEIHGYAAEEIGLVGSQDIARSYKAAGKNVITMVQHDMNLYKAPGQPDKIWFVTNNTVDSFNDALGAMVDRYVQVAWGKKSLFGGDSDHSSWRRQGFVTAFPFEDPAAYNKDIHTSRDSLEKASAVGQVAAFAKLGIAYLAHYAGL